MKRIAVFVLLTIVSGLIWQAASCTIPMIETGSQSSVVPGITPSASPCAPGAVVAGVQHWGRVARVSDGDTVVLTHVKQSNSTDPDVSRGVGKQVRVRLWGIDAPETAQPLGDESGNRLSRRLPINSPVVLVKTDEDHYGRWVGVIAPHPSVTATNVDAVMGGDAYHFEAFGAQGNSCLSSAQDYARSVGAGVWGIPNAEKPWDYRERTR